MKCDPATPGSSKHDCNCTNGKSISVIQQRVHKLLQTEAGASRQSLSYVYSVVWADMATEWDGGGGPRVADLASVADLGAQHKDVSVCRVCERSAFDF